MPALEFGGRPAAAAPMQKKNERERCHQFLETRRQPPLRIMRDQLTDNEWGAPVFVWTREISRNGEGEHMHVLIHVPPCWQRHFKSTLARWFSEQARLTCVRPITRAGCHDRGGATLRKK
jgi:hypothetical protein